MISDIMYILYGCVNMSTDKTISKGLKTRLKQWKRVSKYLKKAGYVITSENGNFIIEKNSYAECYVIIGESYIHITTPFEKIDESMFPGQTTLWLYNQILERTNISFAYDADDGIRSFMSLTNPTDSTVYEAVNIIFEGYVDFLLAVNKIKATFDSKATSE